MGIWFVLIRNITTNSMSYVAVYLWLQNLYFFNIKCSKMVVIFFIILYNQESMITYDEKCIKGDEKWMLME